MGTQGNGKRSRLSEDEKRERQRLYMRTWRAANPDRVRATAEANRETYNAKARARYAANVDSERERLRLAIRARRAADPTLVEKERAQGRVWYAANRERKAAAMRLWETAHPDAKCENAKAWRKANPERSSITGARANASRRARTKGVFVEVVDRYVVFDRDNGICRLCGEPVGTKKWHVDHVIPIVRGGLHSYDNVQLAHATCNLRKAAK